jgi:outer membrane protein OmpA-like peptidoglycan-associated protein
MPFIGQLYEFSKPERLPGMVNSSAEESNPVLSYDGKTLYFVRTFDTKNSGGIYDQDIWVSSLNKGNWTTPKSLTALNNKLHNAVISTHLSPKDSTTRLYVLASYAQKDARKGISIAERNNGDSVWTPKGKLPIPSLDISGKYVGYFLSKDESVLIVSYEGSDSEGEEDLYFSIKNGEEWSDLETMGATINSPGFEISPFLSSGKDTLFFSSNGFKGQGDADIFYSVRKGKWNAWSKPVNLGKGINTSNFDAYFSLNGNKALWSSNRDGQDLDLWTSRVIPPPKLLYTVSVKDVSTFQGNDGSIDVQITSGVPPYKFQWSNGQSAQDLSNLRKGEYKLTITDSIGQKVQETLQINEPAAKVESVIRFPNIQYKFGSWDLISDSTVNSLDSLLTIAKLLEDYPKMIIELISHTDSRGEDARNQVLSENRAKACYIYLVTERNIDPRRIVPIGKGESIPSQWFDPMQKTYVALTEEFIQQQKDNPTLFEYLHQLNRRTEGKVLRLDFDPINAPSAPKEYLEFQAIPK